jgi:hypothetical protein
LAISQFSIYFICTICCCQWLPLNVHATWHSMFFLNWMVVAIIPQYKWSCQFEYFPNFQIAWFYKTNNSLTFFVTHNILLLKIIKCRAISQFAKMICSNNDKKKTLKLISL